MISFPGNSTTSFPQTRPPQRQQIEINQHQSTQPISPEVIDLTVDSPADNTSEMESLDEWIMSVLSDPVMGQQDQLGVRLPGSSPLLEVDTSTDIHSVLRRLDTTLPPVAAPFTTSFFEDIESSDFLPPLMLDQTEPNSYQEADNLHKDLLRLSRFIETLPGPAASQQPLDPDFSLNPPQHVFPTAPLELPPPSSPKDTANPFRQIVWESFAPPSMGSASPATSRVPTNPSKKALPSTSQEKKRSNPFASPSTKTRELPPKKRKRTKEELAIIKQNVLHDYFTNNIKKPSELVRRHNAPQSSVSQWLDDADPQRVANRRNKEELAINKQNILHDYFTNNIKKPSELAKRHNAPRSTVSLLLNNADPQRAANRRNKSRLNQKSDQTK